VRQEYCRWCDGAGRFPIGYGAFNSGYRPCTGCLGTGLVYADDTRFDNGIRHDEGEG